MSVEPTTSGRPGRMLWLKSVNLLRAHLRAVAAFQNMANLRRRANMMAQYALTGTSPTHSSHANPTTSAAGLTPIPERKLGLVLLCCILF